MKAGAQDKQDLTGIVSRARSGDPSALRQLLEHTQDGLFRFCYYLCGNRALAEDITQDALVRVLEELHSLKDAGAFQSWLFRVAKNLYLDFVKSAKNKNHIPLDDLSLPEPSSNPDSIQILKIREALGRLDSEDRPLLLLADLEGHSYAEIAKIMGISEAAVRSRLHRARQIFLRLFSGE
jgi:RNA polymerase sigma-70 factor (ECF subfamily)